MKACCFIFVSCSLMLLLGLQWSTNGKAYEDEDLLIYRYRVHKYINSREYACSLYGTSRLCRLHQSSEIWSRNRLSSTIPGHRIVLSFIMNYRRFNHLRSHGHIYAFFYCFPNFVILIRLTLLMMTVQYVTLDKFA